MSWCPDNIPNPIGDPMKGLDETLRRDVAAGPDLTSSIMHRVGFARCSEADAKRLRRRRMLRTAAMLFTVATVLGFGIDFYRTHRAVRVPAGPTIPAALHHDLERQHERLDATFRTFRRLAPPAQPAPPPPEPDPKAMAPVRWILISPTRTMRRFAVILMLAVLGASGTSRAEDPFADAALAPPDTAVYVHLSEAADLRHRLADRPLLRWVDSMLAHGELGVAWNDLAARAGVTPQRLFDQWLGGSMTYLSRPSIEPDAPRQWALVADVDPDWARDLARRLQLRPRGPRGAVGVAELPEQALLVARSDRTLVIGPKHGSALFEDVLDRVSGDAGDASSLAAAEAVQQGRELGPGRLAVIVRHPRPLGGWSSIIANLEDDRVQLRHASRFDSDPIQRRITDTPCDFTPLVAFRNTMLLAFAEPTDVGDGPFETWVSQRLGTSLLTPELAANVGPRRLVAVGEQEGRMLAEPQDLQMTTVALCLEVNDAGAAEEQVDQQLRELAARLDDLGRGAFLIDMSDARCTDVLEPRCIDISDATSWFTGGFPVMRDIKLNWTVIHGPNAAWAIIATNRSHLDDVGRCLQSPPPSQPRWCGKFDNAGFAAGPRLARHVLSWAPHAEAFSPTPADGEAFRQTLQLAAAFAEGIRECSWTMTRPAPREVRFEVELILSPSESATGLSNP